jgi:hypothetical protein
MAMQHAVSLTEHSQTYVPFFTWNGMVVNYLNGQNAKTPGKENIAGS